MKTILPTGQHLSLRALEPEDLDALYLWENSPEMWQYGVFTAPYSRHQLWEYIQNYDSDPLHAGQLRLMVDVDGVAVGTTDLYNIDAANSRAMIGIMVSSRHRRNGYALAALGLLGQYAAGILALRQLASTVAEDNPGSVALFEKAGYRQTATLPSWVRRGRSYVDAFVFQKFISE